MQNRLAKALCKLNLKNKHYDCGGTKMAETYRVSMTVSGWIG